MSVAGIGTQQLAVVATIIGYLLLLLVIGEYARRKTRNSREDYFLASRSFKTVSMFFGLLATFITSFAIIGVPGMAYEVGIGLYGYLYGFTSLLVPVLIATVGYRIWIVGKRFGHVTPAHIINHRYQTEYLGGLLSGLMTFWTLPYLLLGVMGGGIVLDVLTDGLIPYPVGAGLVTLVVLLYVVAGGMRGATWTNILQGILFIGLLVALFAYLGSAFGGFAEATAATAEANPGLLDRAGPPFFGTMGWLTFVLFMGLSMMMFPQMFLRFFTALSHNTFKRTVLLFPIGIITVGATTVLLGFWGAGQIPGLTGQQVDQIFPMLLMQNLPFWLIGFGLVMVLAAIMSSLDAQTLTVSTIISEDMLRGTWSIDEGREVLITRGIITFLLVAVYGVSLLRIDTIFQIGMFAFQGYALLFYPFAIGLYWKNATAPALLSGWIAGFVVLWLFQLGVIPAAWAVGGFIFIPALLLQIVIVHAVSYLTTPPSRDRVEEYFESFAGTW